MRLNVRMNWGVRTADWAGQRLRDLNPLAAAQAAQDLEARREERRKQEWEAAQQAVTMQDIYARAKTVSPGFCKHPLGFRV